MNNDIGGPVYLLVWLGLLILGVLAMWRIGVLGA